MNTILAVTPHTYASVVKSHQHLVLTIKMVNCKPCAKGLALFTKYVEESRKDNVVFAVLELDPSQVSKHFVVDVLEVQGVPCFDVYHNGIRVFRTTSPKNFSQLEDYIEKNLP